MMQVSPEVMSQYEKFLRKAIAIEENPTQEESIILRALSTQNPGGGWEALQAFRYKNKPYRTKVAQKRTIILLEQPPSSTPKKLQV